MSTSGSVNFNRNRNQIIQDTYRLLNIYDPDEEISAQDLDFANVNLNKLIKHWQNMGMNLWILTEGTLFLTKDTASYTLSDASTSAYAALTSDSLITTLNANAAANATTLTVVSTTGMTIGDNIGILLSSGAMHWTTIATIPSSTSLTISSGLATASVSGKNVYTFTNRITQPLRIMHMRRVYGSGTSQIEIPLMPLSRMEYLDISVKNISSVPNSYYYDRQLSAGVLYIWPAPSDVSNYIKFTYERLIEDFDNATDSPDLPPQWLLALTFNLGSILAPTFNCVGPAYDKIDILAAQYLDEAKNFDVENESIYLVPTRGRQ